MTPKVHSFMGRLGFASLILVMITVYGCSKPKQPTQPANQGSDSEEKVDWQKIDQMHADGVKAFPAKTEGKGNQPLQAQMDGQTKVFNITTSKLKWEVTPGTKVDGYAYNGQIPGPILRVTEGDKVRVVVKNEMDESTSIHWHGLRLENKADGVPYLTQDPIKPGETYTYDFTAVNAGTHMYHSHHNATAQVVGGMLGALIVDPKDPAVKNQYGEDLDQVIIVNDGMMGYTINGKGFPATEPIVVKKGQKVRLRFLNEGQQIHPMHLHGLTMEVVERDGYPLPQPYRLDTVTVAPGERWDVIVEADNEGTWAFHCHILSHAESEHGMHGMVTVMIVQ